ncbi:hypothetical protein H4582DRAFT_1959318 [Lactarius indigo]|nr:hypothetical protein H4582DRAFT_1959318 [Lactarius indigo]
MSQTQEDSQALTFWYPSTPSQHGRRSQSSCSPTPKHAPPAAPHSPPPTKRPRRDVPQASSTSAPPPPATVPTTTTTSRYRRARGSSPPAINAEFEIDPGANAGVPFAFDEVVRGRQHRHALGAGECEECRDVRAPVYPPLPCDGLKDFTDDGACVVV